MNTHNKPLVSIIMPVFNAAEYLRQAIQSVRDQSYANWELIIVNDGSTDHSEKIIKSINDNRLRYFYKSNGGVSSARNLGLKHMQGEYVCFLDADDVFPPESLAIRLNVFREHQDVAMVDGHVEVYDEHLKKVERNWRPKIRGRITSSLVRLTGDCFFSITWMIKIIPGVHYEFDERMTHAEDLMFLTKVSTLGNYDYADGVTYCYRQTPNSAMRKIDALGRGYGQYFQNIKALRNSISLADQVVLFFKIRKIMFLTYLSRREAWKAFQYLITGSI